MPVLLVCCLLSNKAGAQNTPFAVSSTCVNDTSFFLIINPAGIDSVKWFFNDPPSGDKDSSRSMRAYHIYTSTGTYTDTLIAWRNGVPDTTIQPVTIVTPVIFDLGDQDITLCEGGTMTLQAPIIPGATYLWQDSSTGSSILVDTSATYKVKINGCPNPDSVNVFYTPIPEIDLGKDLILCTGEHIALDATAQNCTYLWSTGNTEPTQDVYTSGTYHVDVYPKGCPTVSDDITITFTGAPYPFSLGPDTLLCPGETIRVAPAIPEATKWEWSTGATTPSVTIRNTTNLWALVEINNTCSVVDTIFINYNRLKKLDLGNDTSICKGNFLVLTADFGNGQYLWQDGSDQATYYVTKPGFYYVHAQIGRCESMDSISVKFEDTLRVNLGPDTLLCRNEVYQLRATGAGGGTYKWQDSTSTPMYTVTRPGFYAMVATNSCGTSVDSVEVKYHDCECQLYFPTAFSPNGDGRNDYFRPVYRCPIYDYTLSIYNRWGERIFYTTDPQVGWNGRVNGTLADIATYVWIVDYKEVITRFAVHKTGTITLVN
ncbi:gliding motility-associated C-terminal domain-containing protein [Chitinophaga ginsengisegetis]|uniref:Gliding motility-associated C-terminal domain-containing protein n=1 Tax=Chitinophaga ginsengisegetis TaxID=393003 RepID=A0A1T5NZP1_9BACT|nr:gliding motility-associated C-terminal domain-containing protein [Chitinophaga ginsengisegetis]SKD05847.1 gliding motility-associated C-terminal domain-containing protein [Chitinophaga ginsengisegetis]